MFGVLSVCPTSKSSIPCSFAGGVPPLEDCQMLHDGSDVLDDLDPRRPRPDDTDALSG